MLIKKFKNYREVLEVVWDSGRSIGGKTDSEGRRKVICIEYELYVRYNVVCFYRVNFDIFGEIVFLFYREII